MSYSDEYCPIACPMCGEVVDHASMKPARLAASNIVKVTFNGKLLCRKCIKRKRVLIDFGAKEGTDGSFRG